MLTFRLRKSGALGWGRVGPTAGEGTYSLIWEVGKTRDGRTSVTVKMGKTRDGAFRDIYVTDP